MWACWPVFDGSLGSYRDGRVHGYPLTSLCTVAHTHATHLHSHMVVPFYVRQESKRMCYSEWMIKITSAGKDFFFFFFNFNFCSILCSHALCGFVVCFGGYESLLCSPGRPGGTCGQGGLEFLAIFLPLPRPPPLLLRFCPQQAPPWFLIQCLVKWTGVERAIENPFLKKTFRWTKPQEELYDVFCLSISHVCSFFLNRITC